MPDSPHLPTRHAGADILRNHPDLRTRPQRPREESETDWRPMTARYSGRCCYCGEQFEEGDEIAWNCSTRKTAHRSCGD
jgi:hypothetical protein